MNSESGLIPEKSSFRDPGNFVAYHNGEVVRFIHKSSEADYNKLMSSGLYEELISEGLLIPHETINPEGFGADYPITIKPKKIGFISYPYEWSFSELKDAALTTLRIADIALKYDMILKDSSAYNIQFFNGLPVLIDTCSFQVYEEGQPWIAYRQFCQHFLAPLALAAYTDFRLTGLLQKYLDGIPLDLCSKLLPFRTSFKTGILIHIHIHAKSQKKYASSTVTSKKKISKFQLKGIFSHLEQTVKGLRWKLPATTWKEYYDHTNYSSEAASSKKSIITAFIGQLTGITNAWDAGANDGTYSELLCEKGINTIAFDIDEAAVELNYLRQKSKTGQKLLPLILDITNPSPSIGWNNQERPTVFERGKPELIMALALIHHLVIGNNLSFKMVAEFFANYCNYLIIEFIPDTDTQVKKLLAHKAFIKKSYRQDNFEEAFCASFTILKKEPVKDSDRVLYLLQVK